MSEQNENASEIVFTDEDLAAALDVLSRCPVEGRVDLFTLSDEEVVTIDGQLNAQVVPTPWLDQYPNVDKEFLGEVVMRGLQNRGLAIAIPLDTTAVNSTMALDVHTDVRGVFTLRRSATDVVAIQLTTADLSHWFFGYGHQDNKTLVETISAAGQHSFDVCPDADFLTRIIELTQLGTSIGMDRQAQEFPAAQFQSAETPPAHLDEAIAVVSVAAVGTLQKQSENPEYGSVNFFVGPTWVRQVTEVGGSAGVVTVREVSSSTIQATIKSVLKASAPPANPTANW